MFILDYGEATFDRTVVAVQPSRRQLTQHHELGTNHALKILHYSDTSISNFSTRLGKSITIKEKYSRNEV
jgi:hypothetical protein